MSWNIHGTDRNGKAINATTPEDFDTALTLAADIAERTGKSVNLSRYSHEGTGEGYIVEGYKKRG